MKLLSSLKLPPGYIQGQLDHIIFARIFNGDKFAILIVYVGDILTGDDIVEMERLKKSFRKNLRSSNEVHSNTFFAWYLLTQRKELRSLRESTL